LLLSLSLLLQSCVSYEELVNFQRGEPIQLDQLQDIENQIALRIQPDDILHIRVFSKDPTGAAAQPFNLLPTGSTGNMGLNRDVVQLTGYLVNETGSIDFPIIGKIEVGGLTLQQARDMLSEQLKDYLVEPVVNVRLVNFRVIVMGEVQNPGTYSIQNERLTLLEALSMAGDLTSYARRDSILIIREENGQRNYARLDLHDSSIFLSPYFYLRQNDAIYVEPIEEKVAAVRDRTNEVLPWVAAFTSFVSLLVAFLR